MDSSAVVLAVPALAASIVLKMVWSHHYEGVEEAKSWVIIACICVVVALTVFFEVTHEYFEERLSSRPSYLRMFNVLTKEITLLGFIGLCLFLSGRFGLVSFFARFLPALEEGEHKIGSVKSSEAVNEVVEVFESVHMFVFLIMVFFLLLSAWLLRSAHAFEQALGELNATNEKTKDLAEDVCDNESTVNRAKSGILDEKTTKIIAFRAIRREFIRPVVGRPNRLIASQQTGRFRFTIYLSICCSDDVLEIIEVPPSTMLVFVLLAILLRTHVMVEGTRFFYGMALFPSICTGVLMLISRKLKSITAELTPPLERVLDDTPGIEHCAPVHKRPMIVSKSKLQAWLCGTGHPTKHQTLFWFWAKGPAFIRQVVRLILLCMSCYFAVVPAKLLGYERKELGVTFFGCLFVSCCAVIKGLQLLPGIIEGFTITTNIESMKSPIHIKETLEIMTHGVHAQCFSLFLRLEDKHITDKCKEDPAGFRAKMTAGFDKLTEAERRQANEAFEIQAKEHDGKTIDVLHADDLGKCLKLCGLVAPDANFVATVMAGAVDSKGMVARDAYHALFKIMYDSEHEPMSFEALKQAFVKIDTSHNSKIDAGELHVAFSHAGVAASIDLEYCRDLLLEVINNSADDGEESEEEDAEADEARDVEVSFDQIISWMQRLESRLNRKLITK